MDTSWSYSACFLAPSDSDTRLVGEAKGEALWSHVGPIWDGCETAGLGGLRVC